MIVKIQVKNSNFIFGLLTGAFLASLFFSILKPSGVRDADCRNMKIAHGLPTTHPIHAGIVHFAEQVKELSDGKLRFDVFPNEQLGSSTQVLEQIQAGTLEAAQVGSASLSNFTPIAKLFSLPYLFRSEEHYWEVLDGDIGTQILNEFSLNPAGEATGFRGLAYYDSGSRNFYTKKPVTTPADLQGLKIRVQNDPVAIDMVKAMGASPTPISFGELYTALQQGVVDGAENNPASYVLTRHFEVCKHFTFDHHSRNPDVLLISENTWQSFSPEEQNWIRQAAKNSSKLQRKLWASTREEAIAEMQKEQVSIYEVDITPFIEITQPVRDRYAVGVLKEYLNKIQN